MRLAEFWKAHPLGRRLPFLLVAGVGLWLWQTSAGARRELIWQLEGPGWSAITQLEFQIRAEDGTLLKREERFFPEGAGRDVRLELKLPEGEYPALVLARPSPAAPVTAMRVTLTVADGEYVTQALRLPAVR